MIKEHLSKTWLLHPDEIPDSRLEKLMLIRAALANVFRNRRVENEWLREPHQLLGDLAPLYHMLYGDIDLVMEIVEYLAGR